MKKLGMLAAIASVVASHASLAAAEKCFLISREKERLACFDRRPIPVPLPKPQELTGKEKSPSEFLRLENELLSKRMNKICRGC